MVKDLLDLQDNEKPIQTQVLQAIRIQQEEQVNLYLGHVIIVALDAGFISSKLIVERCPWIRPSVAKELIAKLEREGLIKETESPYHDINESRLKIALEDIRKRNLVTSSTLEKEIPDDMSVNQIATNALVKQLIPKAIECIIDTGFASASFLQRRLRVEYSTARAIIDQLERLKIISPNEPGKPREVMITYDEWLRVKNESMT